MNIPIEVLYLSAMGLAILASSSQVRQLVVTKESDELSLGTWATWTASQIIATFYAVSINSTAYTIVSLLWLAFYVVMVTLIIRYRKKQPLLSLEPSTILPTDIPKRHNWIWLLLKRRWFNAR